MRLVIEIENERDANLLISLVKRLKGKILEEKKNLFRSKKSKAINVVASLESISKRGGIASIDDPSEWQRNERADRKLSERN